MEEEDADVLITCLSSGGEHDPGYINTLTGVGFLRRCDPAVVFTLQTESHASPRDPVECMHLQHHFIKLNTKTKIWT